MDACRVSDPTAPGNSATQPTVEATARTRRHLLFTGDLCPLRGRDLMKAQPLLVAGLRNRQDASGHHLDGCHARTLFGATIPGHSACLELLDFAAVQRQLQGRKALVGPTEICDDSRFIARGSMNRRTPAPSGTCSDRCFRQRQGDLRNRAPQHPHRVLIEQRTWLDASPRAHLRRLDNAWKRRVEPFQQYRKAHRCSWRE